MAIVLNVFHVDILTCLEIILGEGKASDTVPLKDLLGGTGLTRELFDANAWFLESFGLIAIEPSKYKNAPTASVRLSITEMGSTALSVAPGRRRHSLPRIWRVLGDSFVSYLTDGESLYTGRGQRVPGADLATLELLNHLWARDKKSVYCAGSRIKADRKTFRVLNAIFAKDKDSVYFIEGPAKYIDASSFEVLDEGMYSTSGYLNEVTYHGYGRDKSNVYFQDMMSGKPRLVRGADRDTFRHVQFSYGVDASYVYREEKRLPKADPKSFQVLTELFSRDKRRVYYGNRPIVDADPETFLVLPGVDQKDMRLYAKDKERAYCRDRRLDQADATTFEKIGEFSATDGHHVWKFDELMSPAPRKAGTLQQQGT